MESVRQLRDDLGAFNRTIVELKSIQSRVLLKQTTSFNRTIVELKFEK